MTVEIFERLARLDVCALSDALDRLGLPSSIGGIVPRTVRGRISGRVVTVRLVAGPAPSDAPARHLCAAAIDAAERGDIVVVEQATGIEAAGWGGILANAAKAKGLAGVILEGPARDIDEAADIGFPVFSRSATPRTARGRIHEESTGRPITVGGLTIETGDFVAADSSGLAFISAAHIAAVLDAAERIAAREADLTAAVLGGETVSSVMGANYEHMLTQPDPESGR